MKTFTLVCILFTATAQAQHSLLDQNHAWPSSPEVLKGKEYLKRIMQQTPRSLMRTLPTKKAKVPHPRGALIGTYQEGKKTAGKSHLDFGKVELRSIGDRATLSLTDRPAQFLTGFSLKKFRDKIASQKAYLASEYPIQDYLPSRFCQKPVPVKCVLKDLYNELVALDKLTDLTDRYKEIVGPVETMNLYLTAKKLISDESQIDHGFPVDELLALKSPAARMRISMQQDSTIKDFGEFNFYRVDLGSGHWIDPFTLILPETLDNLIPDGYRAKN